MKNWIVLIIFLLPFLSLGQSAIKLKKKYLGTYMGTVPEYQVQSDKELMNVSSSAISLDINSDKTIGITIGNHKMVGTYCVLFKTKTYYVIEAKTEGESYIERFKLYRKGNVIEREGLYPQPDTELVKI